MKKLLKRQAFLESVIRLEERDLEVIKTENRQARQVQVQAEESVICTNREISELESLIRAQLSGESPFNINELQSQRAYLAHKRAHLLLQMEHKAKVVEMAERIEKSMVQKQKKINKLNGLVDDVAKCIWQAKEKCDLKESDELWVQSREHA
jgi:hypothetical protein